MVPTVGMPWRQISTSDFAPSVNVWFWLWPSIERSAGRLPASTCTETVVALALSNSPRYWNSLPLPPADAPAATTVRARAASARVLRRRSFIGLILLGETR